jgi:hypothetical protein
MKCRIHFVLLPLAALLSLTACKTEPQMTSRPDFLSSYNHLQKVDATTWRYVSAPLLANCSKFVVSPVKVLFKDYDGKPITDEQRQHSADFVRQTVTQAIGSKYPIVSEPGPGTAEIRIAVTEAYGTAGKLGLCVQGEILDNSNTQVAAVVRTELSQYYSPSWEDKETARQMVNEWSQRLLKTIDQARGQ